MGETQTHRGFLRGSFFNIKSKITYYKKLSTKAFVVGVVFFLQHQESTGNGDQRGNGDGGNLGNGTSRGTAGHGHGSRGSEILAGANGDINDGGASGGASVVGVKVDFKISTVTGGLVPLGGIEFGAGIGQVGSIVREGGGITGGARGVVDLRSVVVTSAGGDVSGWVRHGGTASGNIPCAGGFYAIDSSAGTYSDTAINLDEISISTAIGTVGNSGVVVNGQNGGQQQSSGSEFHD